VSIAKTAATALLALAFASQFSVAALAEDSDSDDDKGSYTVPTRPMNPEPNWRKGHDDHDKPKRHGDDDFQISVPPMVITPDDEEEGENEGSEKPKSAFKVSPPQGGTDATTTVPDVDGNQQVIEPNSAAFDPNANEPINVQNINPTKKTPADVFIESAQVGVGAMAAGAAILGVTAAVRGSRFRRQAKTDFIYEVETKE
jgi:hypothetical protein